VGINPLSSISSCNRITSAGWKVDTDSRVSSFNQALNIHRRYKAMLRRVCVELRRLGDVCSSSAVADSVTMRESLHAQWWGVQAKPPFQLESGDNRLGPFVIGTS